EAVGRRIGNRRNAIAPISFPFHRFTSTPFLSMNLLYAGNLEHVNMKIFLHPLQQPDKSDIFSLK
ncbi:hypothetical protein LI291_14515, partial [Intestinibacillus massiliensis]|nr:hypothetical protein [Intestinibacillus massiliensis]